MAKDPYKYFRVEAGELLEGLSQGIIELEKSGSSKELVGRLLRLAHTLKGAARVVKQKEVSELAHSIEDLLAPFRDSVGVVPTDSITQLLALVDACGESLKSVLSSHDQVPGRAGAREAEEVFSSVRVEITEVDAILYGLADAGSHLGALCEETAAFERIEESASRLVNGIASMSAPGDGGTRAPALSELHTLAEELRTALKQTSRSHRAALERSHREVVTIRDRANDLRLLPARSIFAALERTARDAAEALHKSVNFAAVGGEHRLDAHVLLALRDALAHAVRNAVAHGIETPSKRVALGKPGEGRVRLQVHKRGRRIHFAVTDDGGGVNIVAIRDSLIAKKLISPGEAESLDLPTAIQRLLEGGLSTAPEVTEVMGRGIGLDVVRTTVARLKGDVSVRSDAGRGTTVEMMVPVSIESIEVLAVVAGEYRALIPFDAIHKTVRLANEDLARSENGTILVLGGQALPFLPLSEILSGNRSSVSGPRRWTTLVMQSRGMQAAIGVDRLVGVRCLVVRPLPALCGSIPLVLGATLDGKGDPELVLDPAALVTSVCSNTESVIEPNLDTPLPLLVVDDSLTSRMLEQSILETAGYQVELATSGEEALEKARQRRYAVFVVDVEMPGMNGFELLETFRADPDLRNTPAILVTSRASADDRLRGRQAGARAHIAKGEFEEGHLLRAIRGVLGGEAS